VSLQRCRIHWLHLSEAVAGAVADKIFTLAWRTERRRECPWWSLFRSFVWNRLAQQRIEWLLSGAFRDLDFWRRNRGALYRAFSYACVLIEY